MKLPSLQQIAQEMLSVFRRFPLVMLDAMVGTVTAVMLIEHEGSAEPTILLNILLTALLGFPFLLGIALIAEKRAWTRAYHLAAQVAGVILLFLYSHSLPVPLDGAPAFHIVRFLLLLAAAILFLMAGPFGWNREQNGFWQFNKQIILRAAIAVFYSGVLQLGLSLALAALEELFGMNIPGRRYGELWAVIAGLFATSFFLAGVPEDWKGLEQSRDYPKGVKIFAQHILSTVILVYLVILYAYIIKIILAWSWPQGWVSGLILGFSASGLLALLLLWPIREREENKWGRLAWRWFFILLLPPVVMLFLAIWRRVSEYGFTESRYLGIAVALYLAILVLYFTLSRSKNIKMIPGLLGLFALLACLGPWSIKSVSEKSQTARLQSLLSKNEILVDGKINKPAVQVPEEDALQISSVISYLEEMHGYDRIQSWFSEKLVKGTEGKQVRLSPSEVTGLMGIEYMRGVRSFAGEERTLSGKHESILDISGYDHMFQRLNIEKAQGPLKLGESGLSCSLDSTMKIMTLSADESSAGSVQVDLLPLLTQLFAEYGRTNPDYIPLEKMSLTAENDHLKVKIYTRYIRLRLDDEVLQPLSYVLDVLYRAK